jgi:hypothetical protein
MAKISYEDRWHGKVERFNKKFPPGTSATYTAPNGAKFKTHILYPAMVLSSGIPVVWLKNICKYRPLDRVECHS